MYKLENKPVAPLIAAASSDKRVVRAPIEFSGRSKKPMFWKIEIRGVYNLFISYPKKTSHITQANWMLFYCVKFFRREIVFTK